MQRRTGEPISQEQALELICLEIREGCKGEEKDAGRANYQIAMTKCTECGRGFRESAGVLEPVDAEVIEMAECDAQTIDTHVGREDKRSRQSVTPALRRYIFRRDRGQCRVPGCTHTKFLDVHHYQPQSEGGPHTARNCLLLCCAHHKAVHDGRMIIEGDSADDPDDLIFKHADGTLYGHAVDPHGAFTAADAFLAMKSLGFKDSEARRLLDECRPHVGPGCTTETLVAEATRRARNPT